MNEERNVTADTALRLGYYFGTSAKVWIGLQTDYDLEIATITGREALKRISVHKAQS